MGKLTALQIRNLKTPGRYGDGCLSAFAMGDEVPMFRLVRKQSLHAGMHREDFDILGHGSRLNAEVN